MCKSVPLLSLCTYYCDPAYEVKDEKRSALTLQYPDLLHIQIYSVSIHKSLSSVVFLFYSLYSTRIQVFFLFSHLVSEHQTTWHNTHMTFLPSAVCHFEV